MFYFGGGSCGCNTWPNFGNNWGWGNNNWGFNNWGGNSGSSYAIILVLFILLVIIIGANINR